MRWDRYVLTSGDDPVAALWRACTTGPALMVLGDGFDPRASRAIERLTSDVPGPVDVLRIGLPDDGIDSTGAGLALANRDLVSEIVRAAGGTLTEQPYPAVHARRSAGATISRAFHEAGYLERYVHVFVDVSALPRSIFFPFVLGVLTAAEQGWTGNLHVVVCESPEADRAVIDEGAEAPGAIGGFPGPRNDGEWAATIWVPVLGEGKAQQLAALLEAVQPDEVIPVIPFPSRNPRRGDDLVLEHRELLVEGFAVEPRNYLYANESNPFDVYRAITGLHERYRSALRPLGAAKFVLSTHSSKLLSVGVLLVAYEIGLQVMHVSPSRYGLRAGVNIEAIRQDGQLVDLWLTGEPYR